MIWVALLLFAAVVIAPLAMVLRRSATARGRRDAAIDLHRAQLAELDRDLAEQRIRPSEHATAVLEVQRRLLAEAAASAPPATAGARLPVALAVVAVPAVALALYLTSGSPNLPAQPLAPRLAAESARHQQEAALIDELRAKLAAMDPHSEAARQGFVLLGNVEQGRADWTAAADAWQQALAVRFDPLLAAEAAEATARAEGRVGPEAAALFRRSLDASPPDAPWRPYVEKRLAEAAQGG
jgi:cytochrome c-type biogenesis protein CcmH